GSGAAVPGAGSGQVPAAGGGQGVASQQAITAIGGLMQNPCGSTAASLLFETSTDFGQCATDGTGAAVPGAGSGQVPAAGGGQGVASQQAITAIGGLMQNPCGNTAASLLFETSTDFGDCATDGSAGVPAAGSGQVSAAGGQGVASQQ